MSNTAQSTQPDADEPDDWDKRIFSTGCSDENSKLTDCYFEKKDWRLCKLEMETFKQCWKRQGNDQRTETIDGQRQTNSRSTTGSFLGYSGMEVLHAHLRVCSREIHAVVYIFGKFSKRLSTMWHLQFTKLAYGRRSRNALQGSLSSGTKIKAVMRSPELVTIC